MMKREGDTVMADLWVEGNAVQVVVECWLVERYHLGEHCQVFCIVCECGLYRTSSNSTDLA